MALGLAHLLGFHLAPNFALPYLAPNIAAFWRRWHMSLSSWVRDYLFIPLGGSRRGRWVTYRNLLVTMALAGLWHGARWPCVVFGAVQGVMLIVHSAFRGWCDGRPALAGALRSVPGTALRVAFTFVCFVTSLTAFRAPTLAAGGEMLGRMFTAAGGAGPTLQWHGFWLTVALVVAGHALAQGRGERLLERLPLPVRGLAFGAALTLALLLAPHDSKAFIYFQF
jgi:D-alanyl-lipoteichoic acid acyltransferase DltB (MBOAT superfamily)